MLEELVEKIVRHNKHGDYSVDCDDLMLAVAAAILRFDAMDLAARAVAVEQAEPYREIVRDLGLLLEEADA